jgi:hypothetical protein
MLRIRAAARNTAALCILFAAMSALNRDLGRQLAEVLTRDSMREVTTLSTRIQQLGQAAFDALGSFRSDNDAMLAFGVVALLLMVSLFRA